MPHLCSEQSFTFIEQSFTFAMENKKEYILTKAFEVFMTNGYDSTSMTILHQKLNISRGAMYRYFPSKDDLFKAVIDKYVWDVMDRWRIETPKGNITLAQRIDLSYKNMQRLGVFLDGIENLEVVFLNYTALTIQAAKRCPGFLSKLKKHKEESVRDWKISIQKSIELGEIKNDVKVGLLADFFSRCHQIVDDSENTEQSFSQKIKSGKRMMDYIYSLIKV